MILSSARMAENVAQVQSAMRSGAHEAMAFALEKRRVDAGTALESAHARMLNELINSVRQMSAQIKP